jgi:tetrapyrrole methylase family protein/MazG family protein
MRHDRAADTFREFVRVVQALRTPGTGCPWDLEQTHQTLRPYVIEEAYEVLDAIDRGDDRALREELGDLLLQVVLHAQLATDRAAFTIADVVADITAKMVRRHPHVFGDRSVSGTAEVVRNWADIKAAEKRERGDQRDAYDRVPASMPALLRAQQLGAIAAKCFGEEGEIPAEHAERDFGAVLFALCQEARRLGINAEEALRRRTDQFIADCRTQAEEGEP